MSEGAVKVAAHRMRRRYRDLLREEIAQTVASRTKSGTKSVTSCRACSSPWLEVGRARLSTSLGDVAIFELSL